MFCMWTHRMLESYIILVLKNCFHVIKSVRGVDHGILNCIEQRLLSSALLLPYFNVIHKWLICWFKYNVYSKCAILIFFWDRRYIRNALRLMRCSSIAMRSVLFVRVEFGSTECNYLVADDDQLNVSAERFGNTIDGDIYPEAGVSRVAVMACPPTKKSASPGCSSVMMCSYRRNKLVTSCHCCKNLNRQILVYC